MTRQHYTDLRILSALLGGVWEGVPKQTRSRWEREAAEYHAAIEADPEAETTSRIGRVLQAAYAAREMLAQTTAPEADSDGGPDMGTGNEPTEGALAIQAYADAIANATTIEDQLRLGMAGLNTELLRQAGTGEIPFDTLSATFGMMADRYAQITRPEQASGGASSPLVAILNNFQAG
ncbi:MAG: hypothetical protein AAFQ43_00915 [Bacteroidota bacterium]